MQGGYSPFYLLRFLKAAFTFKGVGEMFEDHSADTRALKIPLVLMGGRAQRGPTSALAEILNIATMHFACPCSDQAEQ